VARSSAGDTNIIDDNTGGGVMAEQVNGMRRRQSTAKSEPAGSTIIERQRADEELKTEIDTLLDEIDAVLESNAVEFLASYTQRGGE
jgi:prokaryotic ubiquitin-like protein Pup